jgi:chloramphenicol O-acetyltransferase
MMEMKDVCIALYTINTVNSDAFYVLEYSYRSDFVVVESKSFLDQVIDSIFRKRKALYKPKGQVSGSLSIYTASVPKCDFMRLEWANDAEFG